MFQTPLALCAGMVSGGLARCCLGSHALLVSSRKTRFSSPSFLGQKLRGLSTYDLGENLEMNSNSCLARFKEQKFLFSFPLCIHKMFQILGFTYKGMSFQILIWGYANLSSILIYRTERPPHPSIHPSPLSNYLFVCLLTEEFINILKKYLQ